MIGSCESKRKNLEWANLPTPWLNSSGGEHNRVLEKALMVLGTPEDTFLPLPYYKRTLGVITLKWLNHVFSVAPIL